MRVRAHDPESRWKRSESKRRRVGKGTEGVMGGGIGEGRGREAVAGRGGGQGVRRVSGGGRTTKRGHQEADSKQYRRHVA